LKGEISKTTIQTEGKTSKRRRNKRGGSKEITEDLKLSTYLYKQPSNIINGQLKNY